MSGGPSGTTSPSGSAEKDKDSLWYFTSEQLANSPSRRHGINSDQELSYRQMTAYLIQEMGQRLQVSQLCINTAIVYMHRFYAFHSFTHFHRNGIAAASLFLAAKVEEQPRKLEHVIKAANKCLNQPTSAVTDAYYIEQAQDLVFNENVLLQTLGFDVAIDHPHTHVVKTCHLVKACKDLAQTSYFLASNSLHLTSMCLQYKPTVVACFCIYLACKWSRWEIPQSTEGKHWFHYVDKTVTMDLLKQLTDEFIGIYEKSPARLKSKLNSIKALAQGASNRVVSKDKKAASEEWKMVDMMKMYHSSINTNDVPGSVGPNAYSSQALVEQQSQSMPALLPPPQPPQQQHLRKSELHSSQHRPHHNSSSSSTSSSASASSHNAKLVFPSADGTDHKPSHKQQQLFATGGLVNRPREHSQSAQGHPSLLSSSANLNRANVPPSSSRSSLPNVLPGQTVQRQSTQGHQLDVNYHKSRERCNLPGPSAHGVPSHAGHKLSQKQDPSRIVGKESTARMSDQTKLGGSKMFTSTSMAAPPQYGSGQLGSSSQSNSKMESGQDMPSRSLMHNQRAYSSNSGSSGVALGYHQTHLPRQSSSSSSNKHDQPKPMFVHMQTQQQPPYHKQSAPLETAYNASSHDSQQHLHQPHPSASSAGGGYPPMRALETLHSDDFASTHGGLTQQTQVQPQVKTSSSSLFSPDWNEKLQQPPPLMAGSYNGGGGLGTKESPKKTERDRDRTLDTHSHSVTKKEKNRSHAAAESAAASAALAARGNVQQQQQQLKPLIQKRPESLSNQNELVGTSIGALAVSSGAKRPPEIIAIKQEDDVLRDSKKRKLDNIVPPMSYTELKSGGDISKLQVVNGIETDPDLVRSLLKESLCTTSALLKSEPLPSLYPPAELLEPTNVAAPYSEGAGGEQSSMEVVEQGGSKAEKKKKKDKHKHKEKDKDKSKDREERKKHKKEKDRHKDRDRESDNADPMKIKLPAVGFKIKIPKDRITGDINSGATGHAPSHAHAAADPLGAAPTPTPALKIKISKDKLENYSSGSSDTTCVPQMPATAQSMAALYPSSFGIHNTISATSHSSKKKDRDRDKDKKRSSHDFMKSNGSTSTATSASAAASGSSTSSKSQNAFSKF